MAPSSWAQESTDEFFSSRRSPSQKQCDEIALSVSSATTVRLVDSPGSLSYTVICSGRSDAQQDLVVSFRILEASLDRVVVRSAMDIHGDLVPESTCHGNVKDADPPLSIYVMPYLRGSSWIEVAPCEVEMDVDKEAKHRVFIKHLARYFARCWCNPPPIESSILAEKKEEIRKRLGGLAKESISSVISSTVSKLIGCLPSLFSEEYPFVLTHGDLSVTNILVDENTFEITGIVDWSLAKLMPFGLDLYFLFLATGFMDREGWLDYACRRLLIETFWEEFWDVSGIQGGENRRRTRDLAEATGQIAAFLQCAFRRNADGSPSEEVGFTKHSMKYLAAYLGE